MTVNRDEMGNFEGLGRLLIVLGVFLLVAGAVFVFWPRIPFLGHLPGDFAFQWGSFRFFFPLVTSIIISLILTVVINVFFRIFR